MCEEQINLLIYFLDFIFTGQDMEGFNSSTLKYALVGLGAVAMGVAVYYLSQDDT